MPYTPAPTARKANDYLALAMGELKQARQAIYEVFKNSGSAKTNRAVEELNQARRAIYEVFKNTDPVKINRAMAEALDHLDAVASAIVMPTPEDGADMANALDHLDGVASYHQEMLLLHNEASKRGPYKKGETSNE